MQKIYEAVKKRLFEDEDNDIGNFDSEDDGSGEGVVDSGDSENSENDESGEETLQAPEITPELVDELFGDFEGSKEEFAKGLQVELEHYQTVSGDILTVASIAKDHLKEIPDYYTLLLDMEATAKASKEEEVKVPEEAPIDSQTAQAPAVTGGVPVEIVGEGKQPAKLDDSPETIQSLQEGENKKKEVK